MSPIAFMVMPYGVRETGVVEAGVPVTVDCDALWERAYQPALTDLGYRSVRADADLGAMILPDMIRRLVHADLVLADISLPNANVYYETGLRHAAQRAGCVLVAASWAKPAFDLAQVRHVRFPLTDGTVPDDAAAAVHDVLVAALPTMFEGHSPVFQAVPGYPHPGPEDDAFEDVLADIQELDSDIAEVRTAPEHERHQRAVALITKYGARPAVRDLEALTLLRLLHDIGAWAPLREYVAQLPPRLTTLPLVTEYTALALSKDGDPARAAAQLTALIKRAGPTAERLGLLGGRYKRLHYDAVDAGDAHTARLHLGKAIESYESGMYCDLNDYYPTSNLPGLYRIRNGPVDGELAVETATVALVALRRARRRDPSDPWLDLTALRMAFHQGDVAEAAQLTMRVVDSGTPTWQLATTFDDLASDVSRCADPAVRGDLQTMLDELRPLVTSARVHELDDIDDALLGLKLSTGRPVLVSVGGASGLSDERAAKISTLFGRIVDLLEQREGSIVDGGTASGVMRAMGDARRSRRARLPLVGVAAVGTVALPGTTDADEGATLDPGHTHTVLVPGATWGDEAPWIAAVASRLAGAAASVTLLTNGGEVAYRDVAASVAAGRPVVVLGGTGRTADDIATAAAGRAAPEPAVRAASSELVRAVDAFDDDAVVAVLSALLA